LNNRLGEKKKKGERERERERERGNDGYYCQKSI
jgi:hypothetical protein